MLFFLAFGLFSLYEMRALDRITWKLYNHPFPGLQCSPQGQRSVSNMQGNMRQAILARSDSKIAVAIHEVREAERRVFDNLEVVREKILGDEASSWNETPGTCWMAG